MCRAFNMPMPKSTVNFSPGSPEAALIPSCLLEEQDAETVEAGVLQGEAVLGLVHAEAAGAAGAGGEEHVVVHDVAARDMPCFSRPCRYCTRLPTVKYVGLHWPLLPNSLPSWKAFTSGVGTMTHL